MGLISKIFAWGVQGTYAAEEDTIEWFAFLVVILIVSFLWSTVVRQLAE